MADHDETKRGERHLKATPPVSFPDAATCCVRKSKVEGSYECSNLWGGLCPHLLLVEHDRFCDHPTSHEIYLRTTGSQPGRAPAG